MAVLNDGRIREYLRGGRIRVVPKDDVSGLEEVQFQPSSLDLRLSPEVWKFDDVFTHIDTRCADGCCYPCRFSENDPLVLRPHEFVLGRTVEWVGLPDDVLGRVEGRSSLGRLGVAVHVTAGFIDPGFEGTITLEIVNLNCVPVVLYPFQRVCQIVFEELCEPAEQPYGVGGRGKYQGQVGVTPSRISDDF